MTWPFITSPHLPPQAVVFSVAVWARRMAGALTAAAAAPLIARNLRREIFALLMVPPRSSQFDIGAQPDDALKQEHRGQRQHDRNHRRRGDGGVEVIAD